MANSNEYNDEAYVEASNSGRTLVQRYVQDLWAAGATEANIASEMNDALRDDPPEGFDWDEFVSELNA